MTRLIHGAICTYRRPVELTQSLDALAAQTRPVDHLLVIDNDDDPDIARLVAAHPIAAMTPVEVIGLPENPGPAGAFAKALSHLSNEGSQNDLLITFDDDDPVPQPDVLERLLEIADPAFDDPQVAGIGLRGGILNPRTGIIKRLPSSPSHTTQPADHLHGNWFPCYRMSALATVGGFDHDFFWGFEELDLGHRLIDSGFTLLVTSSLYFEIEPNRAARSYSPQLAERSWRHFYRHRNLIRILLRDRAWVGLASTILLRLLARPLASIWCSPPLTLWHLRTNLKAITEGLRRNYQHPKHPEYLPQ